MRPTGYEDGDSKSGASVVGGVDGVGKVQGREVEGRTVGMVGLDVVGGHGRRSGYCSVCA